jgi:molybdopterin-binding protein
MKIGARNQLDELGLKAGDEVQVMGKAVNVLLLKR